VKLDHFVNVWKQQHDKVVGDCRVVSHWSIEQLLHDL